MNSIKSFIWILYWLSDNLISYITYWAFRNHYINWIMAIIKSWSLKFRLANIIE